MANTDLANGFKPTPYFGVYHAPHEYELTASETIAIGDMVYLTSAGRISIATSSTAAVCGVAGSSCASATVSDPIMVYDYPLQEFSGQCGGSTGGALADIYTCFTSGSCFDLTGTTGIQE